MTSTKVRWAIKAFEVAVKDKALLKGKACSEDTQLTVEHNYIKARAKLERLMENL